MPFASEIDLSNLGDRLREVVGVSSDHLRGLPPWAALVAKAPNIFQTHAGQYSGISGTNTVGPKGWTTPYWVRNASDAEKTILVLAILTSVMARTVETRQ